MPVRKTKTNPISKIKNRMKANKKSYKRVQRDPKLLKEVHELIVKGDKEAGRKPRSINATAKAMAKTRIANAKSLKANPKSREAWKKNYRARKANKK